MPHLHYLAIQTPLLSFSLPYNMHSLTSLIKCFPAWNPDSFGEFDDEAEIMRDTCSDVCPSLRRFYLCFGYWKDLHLQYPYPQGLTTPDLNQFHYYFCNKGPKEVPMWMREGTEIDEKWYNFEGGEDFAIYPPFLPGSDEFPPLPHY